MIEILVVVVLIGFLAALAGPVAGKLIRRSEDMAALATVRQVLAVARLEAVKRSANVVVEVSEVSSSDKRIRLRTFADRANDATVPLPADEAAAAGNCIQDTGFIKPLNSDGSSTDETTLGDVTLSLRIHFRKLPGNADPPGLGAVLFDSCGGNPAVKDIVFLPGGGISLPSSGPATPTDGRGIYFADWQGKNFFRVTVESDLSGKARVDKYVDAASGYYPATPARRWSWL